MEAYKNMKQDGQITFELVVDPQIIDNNLFTWELLNIRVKNQKYVKIINLYQKF